MRKKKREANRQSPVHYDPQVDALYIAMRKGPENEFVEVAPGVHVELNRKREIIGVEILNASQFLKSVLKPLERRLTLAA